MTTILKTALAASLIMLLTSFATAQSQSACPVGLKTIINIGCFSSSDPLTNNGSYLYQSQGYCQCVCAQLNKPVMATTKGSDCYCGDLLPATTSEASNSSCDSPCNGYGADNCGGEGFWSVALTGIESSVGSVSGSPSNSATASSAGQTGSSTQTQRPSVVTVEAGGQTVFVTPSGQAGANSSKSGGGTSKAAIAAGVVVGLILICGIVGGVIFFLRHRRRKAVEEEYRRNAAISSLAAGKAKSETNDARLDPSIFQHRHQSIGSIADERDFSRRILQVRNPDGV